MRPWSFVGKSMPQVSARDKVTGAALYVGDLTMPQMLHAKVLRSPFAHARIVSIDTTRARRLPGVKAVITGADTPHRWGPMHKDQTILAVGKVRFAGEEVAAVAAVDESTALDALELIRVEYEELPGVFDVLQALAPGAPEVHEGTGNLARELRVERGDVDAGFRAAAAIHEATYELPFQYHAFTEPMGTVAAVDASGRLTVWAPTQSVHYSRQIIATALGLPPSKVRVIQPHIGGGFGGKMSEDGTSFIAAALALAARRPVRLVNSRVDDFVAIRPRGPARIQLKMGVSREGHLQAKETVLHTDNGAYSCFAPEIMRVTATRMDSLYRQANIRTSARLVYTNKLPCGSFRGFGNPEMAFAFESHLDALAEMIGMDPVELRLRNVIRQGETSAHGWYMGSCAMTECLHEVVKRSGWSEKRAAFPRQDGVRRRGIGVGAAIHVSSNRQYSNWDGSTMVIKLNEDGRATLICSEADAGQGAATVFTQIAAEVLGMPPDHITVTMPDSDTTPYGIGAIASRLTMTGGNAVVRAAEAARAQLLAIAAEKLEVAPNDLTVADGVIHVVGAADRRMTIADACLAHIRRPGGEGIFAKATWDPPTTMADGAFYGNVSPGYSFAAQAIEVEVDTETGVVEVVRVVAADDAGTPINPLTLDGQVHGCISQGLGYAIFENLAMDNGRLINGNLADYTVPTSESTPIVETVSVGSWEPNGPFGAKGGSECPLSPTAGAVANAVYHATGVRITSLPITPEKILRGLAAKGRR